MDAIVSQMIILFILVIVGYYMSKRGVMDAEFDRKLSELVINVACPCLILSSVMGDTLPDKNLILPLLVVGFVTYAQPPSSGPVPCSMPAFSTFPAPC